MYWTLFEMHPVFYFLVCCVAGLPLWDCDCLTVLSTQPSPEISLGWRKFPCWRSSPFSGMAWVQRLVDARGLSCETPLQLRTLKVTSEFQNWDLTTIAFWFFIQIATTTWFLFAHSVALTPLKADPEKHSLINFLPLTFSESVSLDT